MKRLSRLLIVGGLVAVAVLGATQVSSAGPNRCRTPRPGCFCLDYYDPVVCSGGCVYSNKCVAACAGARNCVPFGS